TALVPDPSASLRNAEPISFWLDRADRPAARPALTSSTQTDLAIVGGGYTGLRTAVLAKERDPSREVVLVEADRIGWAASGRNGGFCATSLSHGEDNGRSRFPREYAAFDRLGVQNLADIEATVAEHGIDCDFQRSGELTVATEPYQVDELAAAAGPGAVLLDRAAVRAELDSPTYLAGLHTPDRTALVDPARLAWGLAGLAERLGVRVVEGSSVTAVSRLGGGLALRLSTGATLRARQAALGTNAFPSLVKRSRNYTVPVYDYVLMTQPLSTEQLASIGWRHRQGVGDSGNQFHYYRLTADNRVLWGGYDAIYHFGRQVKPEYDQRESTFQRLAAHFFQTFPQLAGVEFTHKWGGAIDTCSRFFAFYGTAYSGRVAYAQGYTGLGVGATRFGAQVMLDRLAGQRTERTELRMVRRKPIPFPPEPFAYLGVELTRRSLIRADERAGARNLWLRALDRLGMGFDS
ncbi:MAG: putative oxidoreductase, partial [Frankiales bacterium]|nr:putative oxidoreductase [Frankiales bacterium]